MSRFSSYDYIWWPGIAASGVVGFLFGFFVLGPLWG